MSRFTASPGHTATPRRRAVVLGASMAGLSAAAVLASRFDEVVIVERDELPDEPGDRRGVPQGRHAHGLLPAGLERLEGWFPGLTEELVAGGARYLDIGADVLWYQGGGFRHRFQSGMKGPVGSRALLEHHVRRRVLALPNVSLRQGAGGRRRHGDARRQHRDRRDARRRHRLSPPTSSSTPPVGPPARCAGSPTWATRSPRRRRSMSTSATPAASSDGTPGQDTDWGFLLVLSGPPAGRWGAALPLEGDRWIVTLTGCHGDHPPTDDDGFLAFARSLPTPEVAELLETATPLTAIRTHRTPLEPAPPRRAAAAGAGRAGHARRRGVQLQPHLRPGHVDGHAAGRGPGPGARRHAHARPSGSSGGSTGGRPRRSRPAWQLTTGADFALPPDVGAAGRPAPTCSTATWPTSSGPRRSRRRCASGSSRSPRS